MYPHPYMIRCCVLPFILFSTTQNKNKKHTTGNQINPLWNRWVFFLIFWTNVSSSTTSESFKSFCAPERAMWFGHTRSNHAASEMSCVLCCIYGNSVRCWTVSVVLFNHCLSNMNWNSFAFGYATLAEIITITLHAVFDNTRYYHGTTLCRHFTNFSCLITTINNMNKSNT